MGEHESPDWGEAIAGLDALIKEMNEVVTVFVNSVSEAFGDFIPDEYDDDYDGPMQEFDEAEYLKEIELPPSM